jgi:hypothetical protein
VNARIDEPSSTVPPLAALWMAVLAFHQHAGVSDAGIDGDMTPVDGTDAEPSA